MNLKKTLSFTDRVHVHTFSPVCDSPGHFHDFPSASEMNSPGHAHGPRCFHKPPRSRLVGLVGASCMAGERTKGIMPVRPVPLFESCKVRPIALSLNSSDSSGEVHGRNQRRHGSDAIHNGGEGSIRGRHFEVSIGFRLFLASGHAVSHEPCAEETCP